LFSTFDISSAKILPVTSAKPPAGKATTISMGREGYFSCDQDGVVAEERKIPATKASAGKIVLFSKVIFSSISNSTPRHFISLFFRLANFFNPLTLTLSVRGNQKPKIPLGSRIFSHS